MAPGHSFCFQQPGLRAGCSVGTGPWWKRSLTSRLFCAYISLRLLGFVKNGIWQALIRQLENLLSLSLLKTSSRKEGPGVLWMAEEKQGLGRWCCRRMWLPRCISDWLWSQRLVWTRGSRDSPLILLLKPRGWVKVCYLLAFKIFLFVLYPVMTLAVTPDKPSCSSAPVVQVPSSLFCPTGKC